MQKKSLFLILLLIISCSKAKKEEIQGPRPGIFVLRNIVLFVYQASSTNITNVAITGDFIGWRQEGFPLSYDPNVNLWRISFTLLPGIYQYKYILNGHVFTNDPHNPSVAPDGKGGINSLFEIPAK